MDSLRFQSKDPKIQSAHTNRAHRFSHIFNIYNRNPIRDQIITIINLSTKIYLVWIQIPNFNPMIKIYTKSCNCKDWEKKENERKIHTYLHKFITDTKKSHFEWEEKDTEQQHWELKKYRASTIQLGEKIHLRSSSIAIWCSRSTKNTVVRE